MSQQRGSQGSQQRGWKQWSPAAACWAIPSMPRARPATAKMHFRNMSNLRWGDELRRGRPEGPAPCEIRLELKNGADTEGVAGAFNSAGGVGRTQVEATGPHILELDLHVWR